MKASWFIIIGLSVGAGASASQAGEKTAAAEARPQVQGKDVELARYAKAFVGKGNVTVEIAPYKYGATKQGAIVILRGIEGDWDGKAIVHEVKPGAYSGLNYVTQREGRDYTTLAMRKAYGKEVWELYAPESVDAIALTPSDGAAEATSPRKIYDEYRAQQSGGDAAAE